MLTVHLRGAPIASFQALVGEPGGRVGKKIWPMRLAAQAVNATVVDWVRPWVARSLSALQSHACSPCWFHCFVLLLFSSMASRRVFGPGRVISYADDGRVDVRLHSSPL